MRAEYAFALILWLAIFCYLAGEHAGHVRSRRELRRRRARTRTVVRQSLARSPW